MRRSIAMLVATASAAGAVGVALTAPMTVPRTGAEPGAPSGVTIQASEDGTVGYSTAVEGLTRTGVLRPRPGIVVADLPIDAGEWIVTYSFEARLESLADPAAVVCGVVDADARPRYFTQDQVPVFAGSGWASRSSIASFSLPAMTLGLRCNLVGSGIGSLAFRDVELSVARMDAASG